MAADPKTKISNTKRPRLPTSYVALGDTNSPHMIAASSGAPMPKAIFKIQPFPVRKPQYPSAVSAHNSKTNRNNKFAPFTISNRYSRSIRFFDYRIRDEIQTVPAFDLKQIYLGSNGVPAPYPKPLLKKSKKWGGPLFFGLLFSRHVALPTKLSYIITDLRS